MIGNSATEQGREMRRRFTPVIVALGIAALVAAPALADPDPDLTGGKSFDLNCGSDGTYPVVFVESGLGTFHVTGDSTAIFQSKSLSIDGQLVRATPGFEPNGRTLLTCTFIGSLTGRLFEVTGFFTPAKS
jgi:hypothetical protein